jgi:hypothetical protein
MSKLEIDFFQGRHETLPLRNVMYNVVCMYGINMYRIFVKKKKTIQPYIKEKLIEDNFNYAFI